MVNSYIIASIYENNCAPSLLENGAQYIYEQIQNLRKRSNEFLHFCLMSFYALKELELRL